MTRDKSTTDVWHVKRLTEINHTTNDMTILCNNGPIEKHDNPYCCHVIMTRHWLQTCVRNYCKRTRFKCPMSLSWTNDPTWHHHEMMTQRLITLNCPISLQKMHVAYHTFFIRRYQSLVEWCKTVETRTSWERTSGDRGISTFRDFGSSGLSEFGCVCVLMWFLLSVCCYCVIPWYTCVVVFVIIFVVVIF